MNNLEIRKCNICGKDFEVNVKQKRKIYCDKCREIGYKQRRQEYYKIHKTELTKKKIYIPKRHILVCKRCGSNFTVGSGRPPTLCIDCLKKSNNASERARGYYRKDYNEQ